MLPWSVETYVQSMKRGSLVTPEEETRLRSKFPPGNSIFESNLEEKPGIIVDDDGNILVWSLPDILMDEMLVCGLSMLRVAMDSLNDGIILGGRTNCRRVGNYSSRWCPSCRHVRHIGGRKPKTSRKATCCRRALLTWRAAGISSATMWVYTYYTH